MYIPKKTLNEAFQNTLILKDETSLNILNEVCQEKNIPTDEFAKLIIWQYQNKNSTLSGVTEIIDEVIANME
ncbi:MAG: hypothetical protein IJ187_01380 [Neisseriaceae bacterium]|nr:hypothetical protein [Neisseriaceae bacterium]